MVAASKLRAAMRKTSRLPSDVAGIIDGYFILESDKDRLLAFLEENRRKRKATIPIGGNSLTILWGRGVQSHSPRDFRKKMYKVCIEGVAQHKSRHAFSITGLLPENQFQTNNEMVRSFYARHWAPTAGAIRTRIGGLAPLYKRAMRRILGCF